MQALEAMGLKDWALNLNPPKTYHTLEILNPRPQTLNPISVLIWQEEALQAREAMGLTDRAVLHSKPSDPDLNPESNLCLYMYIEQETGIQMSMAQGRSTKIISMIR